MCTMTNCFSVLTPYEVFFVSTPAFRENFDLCEMVETNPSKISSESTLHAQADAFNPIVFCCIQYPRDISLNYDGITLGIVIKLRLR